MANERLWPIQIEPRYQVFVNGLLEKNGWKHCGADWFQPLFGLTAKTIDGGERAVVEGDVFKGVRTDGSPFMVVRWVQKYSKYNYYHAGFQFSYADGVDCDLYSHRDLILLAHCTDIVAKGDRLTCWECHGNRNKGGRASQEVFMGGERSRIDPPCPTCHGEGQHEIVWKEWW